MNQIKTLSKSILIVLLSSLIGLFFCELILRVKHHYVVDYDIEMWKYAKKLKTKVENKKINHVHVKDKSAFLQKVNIKINNYGQRDINLDKNFLNKYERKFLVLGSSIALGWGVNNDKTFVNFLNQQFKKNNKNWIFINGGVGNYNTERYVNNYFENWSNLGFTDIIIHFFVNDTEVIKETKSNIFLTHTHLGVVVWKLLNSYKSNFEKEKLSEYYKSKYSDNYEGYKTTVKELSRLKKHCVNKKINCYIVLMPDIHKLNPYELTFINKKIKTLSKKLDLPYLDLLDTFSSVNEKEIWNKYNDPHPNEYGHLLMGQSMYKFLNK